MVDERMKSAIRCDQSDCSALDRKLGVCGLPRPAATENVKWIFALEHCPIAKHAAAACLLAHEKEPIGGIDPRKRTPLIDQARLVIVRTIDGDPAPVTERFIDHVIADLESGSADTRALAAAFERFGRAKTPAKSSIVMRAFMTAVIAIVLLYGYSRIFSHPAAPPRKPSIAAAAIDGDPRSLPADGRFTLSVTVEGPLYVGVFRLGEDGSTERLFPPLDRPKGLPWPLQSEANPADPLTVRIPASGALKAPPGRGLIVLVGDGEMVRDAVLELSSLRTAEEIRRLWPDAVILPYEVKGP